MVVKYADNILKGFATSISVVISCIASVFIFDYEITGMFVIGACIVLIGNFKFILIYSNTYLWSTRESKEESIASIAKIKIILHF